MQLRILGPTEIAVDGETITLTAPKQRALLIALVLSRNTVVGRDTLIDRLWEERPPPSARKLLRIYVSQIRRALPPERLRTHAGGYLLQVADEELDAAEFEALVARGRQALRQGHVGVARELLTAALALWRGAALADATGEEFARDEAARLEDARLAAFEDRIEAELALGLHAEVTPELESLVGRHPFRERLCRQLMLALYRDGRQADALACYRRMTDGLREELGLEPSPESAALHRSILRHDPELATPEVQPTAASSLLPELPDATVGRTHELESLIEVVSAREGRLVTLVGPGGIGKTRLAVETAHLLSGRFAAGAVIVQLAEETDADRLESTIAKAVGIAEQGGRALADSLSDLLRSLELLLVLDNLEHLVAAANVLRRLLEAAPRVKLLVTSRIPLRIAGERVFAVPPLSADDANRLFRERAEAAGARLDDADPATIERICERLDGSPLAIELAAPWLRSLSPTDLQERLEHRLALLVGGPRDAPERHRAMRATLDWSHALLEPDAQRLLGELSVFVGGFELADAEIVCTVDRFVERLTDLLDASLLRREGTRYRFLDTVREYASERLGDDSAIRDRHAAHFLEVADAIEDALAGPAQSAWLARVDRDHDNLLAALDWLEHRDPGQALRMAASLGRFWYIRGHLALGSERLGAAIDRAGADADPASLARALRVASSLAVLRGEGDRGRELCERGLVYYRELGDEAGIARSLSNLGAILHAEGDLERAVEVLDESVRRTEELGDDRLRALALNNRGDVALSSHDWAEASRYLEQSLDLLQRLDDAANVARSLYNLGAAALGQEHFDEAGRLFRESLLCADDLGDSEDVAWCLVGLAAVLEREREPYDAATLLQTSIDVLANIGGSLKPFERELFDRTEARLRDAGVDLADAAPLPVEQAIRVVAAVSDGTDPAVGPPPRSTG
jgi:predicted ATPase/DNA-binding SARP family transcriptional activator